jgi:precorrin-2/cobalt-factor-2 C20-methyltransferase
MRGKFYGVGVGPGDPELITLKALKILRSVQYIVAPEKQEGKGSIAFDIIKDHITDPHKVISMVFPMTYDAQTLDESWGKAVQKIGALLMEGQDVAFITLGDPMVYSTYIYMMRLLKTYDVEIETIPGITSFCAAASRLGIALGETNETITIVPSAYNHPNLDKILEYSDNVVLMKTAKNFPNTINILERHRLMGKSVFVSKCSHKDEKIIYDLKSLGDEKVDYLSMVITKKGGLK